MNTSIFTVNKGVLSPPVERKLAKLLEHSKWKKKAKHTVELTFDFGDSLQLIQEPFIRDTLDMITMQVTNIDWVNCDRFYDMPKRKLMAVNIKTDPKASVKIIFSNFNGLINGNYYEGKFQFGDISTEEPFKVLSYIKDGQDILVAQADNETYTNKLNYSRVTQDEFIQMLKDTY